MGRDRIRLAFHRPAKSAYYSDRLLGEAFKLRENEKGLSVTWLEYFEGDRTDQVIKSVKAIRASNLKPGGRSGFAIGKISAVMTACSERKHKIRVIHEPENDNKAHASVRRLPRDDLELLELLAATAWSELVLNADVEAGVMPAPDEEA